MKKNIIIITGILLLGIWIAYTIIMIKAFPCGASRGQFGDMFGGLNSLFSILAFGGLVYTIILQKKEISTNMTFMEKQLKEMKEDRILQFQPIPLPEIISIGVEKPKLFRDPFKRMLIFFSRYSLHYKIQNDSDCIALNLIISARLKYNIEANKETENSSEFYDYIKTNQTTENDSIPLSDDDDNEMLENIREGNIYKLPMLKVDLFYKNIMGSCFHLTQVYSIDVFRRDDDDILKNWLSKINTFRIDYKKELEIYENNNSISPEQKSHLFDELQEKLKEGIAEKDLDLKCHKIPNSFMVKGISIEEYNKETEESRTGTRIPTLSTKCLSKH